VLHVDDDGVCLLRELQGRGDRLIGHGVMIRSLLDEIRSSEPPNSSHS
jgi:hypothetical protein